MLFKFNIIFFLIVQFPASLKYVCKADDICEYAENIYTNI